MKPLFKQHAATRVYLAGKIGKNDWRHGLVPGLRGHLSEKGDLLTEHFTYVGPFFVSCDHGGYHGPGEHGVGSTKRESCCNELQVKRKEIRRRCLAGIGRTDILLAYITTKDCYGTVGEIEHALTLGKRVIVAFAPGVASNEHDDFWFGFTDAEQTHVGVDLERLDVILLNAVMEGCHVA